MSVTLMLWPSPIRVSMADALLRGGHLDEQVGLGDAPVQIAGRLEGLVGVVGQRGETSSETYPSSRSLSS